MNIEESVSGLKTQMLKDKDFFWNNPEAGLKEVKTSSYIISRLTEMGYTNINTNIYKTGIIATLKGSSSGPCILFRSDMDAVVMDDTNRVKHTCGHDAHMTILLALAKLLIENKNKIKGTVKLLFQPDEEGNGGASPMIQNGALENPKVDKAFAIHVWSELKEDTVAIKEGAIMASSDPFSLTIYGKGGHAAMPEKCIDTIYIANTVGKMVKEMAVIDENPNKKIVLGITSITGGTNHNVIPDKVYLKGICRTFDNNLRDKVKLKLKNNIEKTVYEMGGKVDLHIKDGYPATVNTANEVKDVQLIVKDIVKNVETNYITMCSEDFSYFLQNVPGAMIFVGCQKDEYFPQHSENFTVGINPILIGTQIFYNIVKKYLM